MNQNDQLTIRIDSATKQRLAAVARKANMGRAEWIREQVNAAYKPPAKRNDPDCKL